MNTPRASNGSYGEIAICNQNRLHSFERKKSSKKNLTRKSWTNILQRRKRHQNLICLDRLRGKIRTKNLNTEKIDKYSQSELKPLAQLRKGKSKQRKPKSGQI